MAIESPLSILLILRKQFLVDNEINLIFFFLGNRKGERWKRIIAGIYLAFCFNTLQKNQGFSRISQIVTVRNPKNQPRHSKRSCGNPFPRLEYLQRRSQISRASDSEWYPAVTECKKTTKADVLMPIIKSQMEKKSKRK